MIARSFGPVLLTTFCCWLAGCSSPATPAAGNAVTPAAAPASDTGMPFPKLEKGMTAEIIRQKLGNPAEIQPVESSGGKAEVWVYKFEQNLGMTNVAAGMRDTSAMTVGVGGAGMTTVNEPVYTLAEKKSEITLSLLMFNGVLQSQKAKVEETLEHH